MEKSVKDLLADVRQATEKASGQDSPKKKGGSVFKKLVKDWVYDDGTEATPSAETVQDIKTNYPAPTEFDESAAGDNPANKPFSDIYTEAGITSTLSVDDLDAMVNSDDLKSQPTSMKQVAINFALKQRGSTIDIPLADATARDSALDGYAGMLYKRATDGKAENDAKIEAINKEMEEYYTQKQAEIDALKNDSITKSDDYQTFLQRKSAEEQRLVDIIKPFLATPNSNPISVGNDASTPLAEVAKK